MRAVFTSANFTYISNRDLANTWRFMSQHKRLKFELFDRLNKDLVESLPLTTASMFGFAKLLYGSGSYAEMYGTTDLMPTRKH